MAPAPVFKPVDRYFQFALLGMVASGFFALAGTGRLDLATIAFTCTALLTRALVLSGLLRFEIPERAVSIAALFGAMVPAQAQDTGAAESSIGTGAAACTALRASLLT